MTDHAVLIPTSEGAVGGIVSEPEGEIRTAMVLLAGAGRPARSGVNSFWTYLARSLAERGVVVLRVDYAREGETLPIGKGGSGLAWKRDLDLSLLSQVVTWFRERTEGAPMSLAGLCEGARMAIELAGRDPRAFTGTFLLVPYLRDVMEVDRTVDPVVVECFRVILADSASWILVGEEDNPDISRLRQLLGPTAKGLEVEVVPNVALHLLDQPYLQDEARRRLLVRAI